jgi:hypothetical protein
VSEPPPITRPFPPPPDRVRDGLLRLVLAERDAGAAIGMAQDGVSLHRPWDPAGCPTELSTAVWDWCGEVVGWLNHEYAWRPGQLIPGCWERHAHIAHELVLLAVLRWRAQRAAGPEALEDWHRNAYPQFCQRMNDRLGESSCLTGAHQEWPADSRYLAVRRECAEWARRRRGTADDGAQ